MPNRILKETICTSDSMSELNWFEQVLFTRLIVLADDFGIYDARPKIIKGKGFPLDRVTEAQIEEGLKHIMQQGMISIYYVSGKPYMKLMSWDKHQRIRAQKSKFPSISEADVILNQSKSSDSNCCQLTADDSRCQQMMSNVAVIQSNPIQSESESNPNPTYTSSDDDGFDRFWKAYPKKVGKAAARKAFKTANVDVDVLIDAVEKQKHSEQWWKQNGQFIPNPSTWLNQGRWEDELPEGVSEASYQDPWDDPHYYDNPLFGG